MLSLQNKDSLLYQIYLLEQRRQIESIEIIASENYVSPAVLETTGSILTNKYSEGYPGARYYGGNQYIDMVENLAIERAKQLFNVKYVNVQPHSGSSANLAIYMALLSPGDTVMGMALSSGGHLTHGHKVNFSGKIYNSIQYGTDKNEMIDYEQIRSLALEHRPKMIICGYTAYPRIFDYRKFRAIADEVGAYLVADISHIAGLIAGKVFENPCETCDVVMTTTHKTLRGPRGAIIMTNNENIAKLIDKTIIPGCQGGPLNHVIMAKAVAFGEALHPSFQEYAQQILRNAKIFEKVFSEAGIRMTTNGTDNHLLVLDMKSIGLDGLSAEKALESCDISCNKNTIPGDESPLRPSGIRIGTPALTTRGLKEQDIYQVGEIIIDVLRNHDNTKKLATIKEKVNDMMRKFPLFAR